MFPFFKFSFMSSNPGVRTIEEELVNALYKAEAITEDGKACLGKVSDLMLVVNQAHYTRFYLLSISHIPVIFPETLLYQ